MVTAFPVAWALSDLGADESSEASAWAGLSFFLAVAVAVVGLVLSLLALAVRNRSRAAYVVSVGLYILTLLVWLPKLFEPEDPYFVPGIVAAAHAGTILSLLLLPSSRAWGFPPPAPGLRRWENRAPGEW